MSWPTFEVGVIGGGPAGVAAALAATPRRRVVLIDKFGTVGPKLKAEAAAQTLAQAAAEGIGFATAVERANHQPSLGSKSKLQAAGVSVVTGTAQFESSGKVRVGHDLISAQRWILALGSRPQSLQLPGLSRYLTVLEVLQLRRQPHRIAIIGLNTSTWQLAEGLSRLGSRVSLIVEANTEFAGADQTFTIIGAKLSSAQQLQRSTRLNFLTETGPQTLTVDAVIVAEAESPNLSADLANWTGVELSSRGLLVDRQFRTGRAGVWAIGSALAPGQTTLTASQQGQLVGRAASRGLRLA